MASRQEILQLLEALSEYYDRTLSNQNVPIYLDLLAAVPTYSLQQAVWNWIRTSPFFPRVSDLHKLAEKYPVPRPDPLELEMQSLKRRFFTEGSLDLDEWRYLEHKLTTLDRLEEAHHLRTTLHHLQTDYDEDGNMTERARQKYREWETIQ